MFAEFDPPQDTACAADTSLFEPNAYCTAWIPLFRLVDAIKTSSQGGLEAVVSTECALWTANEVQVSEEGKQSSGARAGIEIEVKVDGVRMHPSPVVYCDRLRVISLQVPLITGLVTDPFIFQEFERTKAAHSFHFYKGTPETTLHTIEVNARGIIQCFKDGNSAPCVDVSIDNTFVGSTKAAIGKSTLVVEEWNNWAEYDALPAP